MNGSIFTRNLGLKLGALAVALLLWFHIATEKSGYERTLEVPLVVEGVRSGYVVAEEVPTSALVRFRGRGKRLLSLPWREVFVLVDASDIRSMGTRTLGIENVRYQESADLQALEVVRPEHITIEVDRLATVRLPVAPVLNIDVAAGHTQVGAVSVIPDSVTLAGPESRLRRLVQVETDTLRMRRVRRPFDREVRLKLPDIYNIRLEEQIVRVRVDIQQIGERTFTGVPVQLEGTARRGRYLAQPRTAQVTISGGVKVLESLQDDQIRLVIDLAGRTPDGLTPLEPHVELPDGVTLIRLEPPRFRVTEY